jgi:iron complex outermembrane recepter protein
MSAATFFTGPADMTTSTFNGLSLVLQANNLNNEAYRTYGDSKDKPYEYIKYGRTILFGVNYKM